MDAKTEYAKLCRLDPASPLSHFNYGRALFQGGDVQDLQAALRAFETALKCDADYLLAYLLAGQSCEKLGLPERAAQYYRAGHERATALGDENFALQFRALEVVK